MGYIKANQGANPAVQAELAQMREWMTEQAPEQVEALNQKIQTLRQDEAQATQDIQSKVEAVETAQRGLSAPVPPVVVTADYQVKPADQRVIHDSAEDHEITLPSPKNVYRRRNLVENAETGGVVTIPGSYIGANPDGTGIFNGLVLKPGEGVDYLGFFAADPGGAEDAPEDFRINGELVPPGTKGVYKIKIINTYFAKLPPEEILQKFSELDGKTGSALSVANQANAKVLSILGGLPPDDLNTVLEIALKLLEGETKTAALVNQINQVKATADSAISTAQAVQSLLTDNTPDADLVVNRIAEVLLVFQNYPEGANLLQMVEGKVNSADVVNILTQTAAGKVADARLIKTLNDRILTLESTLATRPRVLISNYTPGTPVTAALATEQYFPMNVPLLANLVAADRVFDLDVRFIIATVASPPPMQFRLRIGASTVLLQSPAIAPGATRVQTARLTARFGGAIAGTSGQIEAQGEIWLSSLGISYPLTATVPITAATVPINTTVDNNFQLSVQFGTAAGASHTIQRRSIVLVAMN